MLSNLCVLLSSCLDSCGISIMCVCPCFIHEQASFHAPGSARALNVVRPPGSTSSLLHASAGNAAGSSVFLAPGSANRSASVASVEQGTRVVLRHPNPLFNVAAPMAPVTATMVPAAAHPNPIFNVPRPASSAPRAAPVSASTSAAAARVANAAAAGKVRSLLKPGGKK